MQRINLNMIPGTIRPRVHVSQYDTSRAVKFALYDGDAPFLPGDRYITIEGTKSDGTAFAYGVRSDLSGSVSGNEVTWTPCSQMTLLSESVECELVVYETGGGRTGSCNFFLVVEEAGIADSVDISETDLPALMELLGDATQATEDAAEAAAEATDAAETATEELESIRSTLAAATGNIVQYSLSGTVLTITTVDYTGA